MAEKKRRGGGGRKEQAMDEFPDAGEEEVNAEWKEGIGSLSLFSVFFFLSFSFLQDHLRYQRAKANIPANKSRKSENVSVYSVHASSLLHTRPPKRSKCRSAQGEGRRPFVGKEMKKR